MIADRQRQTDRQTRSSQYSVNDNEPGAAAKSRHHVRAIDKATTKLEVAITSSSSFKHSSVVNAAVKIPRRRIPATGTRTLRCRAHRGAASRGAPWYGPSLAHRRPPPPPPPLPPPRSRSTGSLTYVPGPAVRASVTGGDGHRPGRRRAVTSLKRRTTPPPPIQLPRPAARPSAMHSVQHDTDRQFASDKPTFSSLLSLVSSTYF